MYQLQVESRISNIVQHVPVKAADDLAAYNLMTNIASNYIGRLPKGIPVQIHGQPKAMVIKVAAMTALTIRAVPFSGGG